MCPRNSYFMRNRNRLCMKKFNGCPLQLVNHQFNDFIGKQALTVLGVRIESKFICYAHNIDAALRYLEKACCSLAS